MDINQKLYEQKHQYFVCSIFKRACLIRLVNYLIFLATLMLISSCNQTVNNGNEGSTPLKSIKIGIFLPTNHTDPLVRKKATRYLKAAKLAIDDLRPINLELILYETDGLQENIILRAQEAINNDIDIAVGTMVDEETMVLSSFLKNSGIKLFSFSDQSSYLGKNTFHMAIGKVNLAEQILDYLMDIGYQKFLILEGLTDTEVITQNELTKLVYNKKGKIARYLKIKENSESLQIMKNSIGIFRSSSEKEAIIILGFPDQNMIFALASLKASLGEDRGERIQVVGLTRWSIEQKLLVEPALEKAWFPFLNKQRFKEFSDRYQKKYGIKPSLESTIAYDSIAAIGALVKAAENNNTRYPFTFSAITNPSGFYGVLGTFRLRKDGLSERLMGVGESLDSQIYILKKPATKF